MEACSVEDLVPGLNTGGILDIASLGSSGSAYDRGSRIGNDIFESYSEDFVFHLKKIRALGMLFKGEVVVDLGAGMQLYGYALAEELGARSYIGVEAFYPKGLLGHLRHSANGGIPFKVIPEDMLTFLRRGSLTGR